MSSWVFLLLLAALASISEGRCRYRESRVRELAIRIPRNCRVKPSVVGEEYWTSVGYDGQLRNGRTTNDFLTLPQSGDGDIRSGWVAYWITKTRYGEGQHYEVFGHAYLRNDGRVCALFAGKNRDVVELCGGFRVLSKNINNPNEELPWSDLRQFVTGHRERNQARECVGLERADNPYYGPCIDQKWSQECGVSVGVNPSQDPRGPQARSRAERVTTKYSACSMRGFPFFGMFSNVP